MLKKGELERKLLENAKKVDKFIEKILESKRPEALYEASKHLIKAGGKRLRPYLVLKACEMVGEDPDKSIPFAAALEILHNFTLIHDDIMDRDELRRGVSTVHTKWNIPIAICAGDLLFSKVFEIMAGFTPRDIDLDKIVACIEKTAKSAIQICEGQVSDISFPSTGKVSEKDYLAMVEGKTSALFKTCAEIGAIIGGGDINEITALGDFAWDAGIAFQLIDDYLGATSQETTIGKPIGNDIREAKKTMIIIHALENSTPDKKKTILKILGNKKATHEEIVKTISILREVGSIDYTLEKAKDRVEKAKKRLEIFPESKAKQDLIELIDYFIERTY